MVFPILGTLKLGALYKVCQKIKIDFAKMIL